MEKAIETWIESRTGLLHRVFSELAVDERIMGRFPGFQRDGLADRFMRLWRFFPQVLSKEVPVSSDRAGWPQSADHIRNRVYRDVISGIR